MKYLLCGYCDDVFNLAPYYKECHCGRTAGAYINNEEAVYSGKHAVCLAIHNGWFKVAAKYREEEHFGSKIFIGWFVPDGGHANFTKVDNVKEHLNEDFIKLRDIRLHAQIETWKEYDKEQEK